MQYLATMRSSELIHWQLMALSIGETLTKKLEELMKQFKTICVLSQSDQPWLRLMLIWLQLTRTGTFLCPLQWMFELVLED